MNSARNGQLQAAPYTVVVGVTGHRFLHRLYELVPRIDAVLDSIEAEWPGAALTVISSLAEGSDRLVVGRVLERHRVRLVVPLPLPEALYMQDFQSSGSRQDFMELLVQANEIVRFPEACARPAGYAAAGQYLLGRADLLIALWDGQPAQGEGGTGALVAAARGLRLPIAWIYTHNYKPGYVRPPTIPPQGGVVFENFEA